jgi:hypothetical protein
MSKPSALDRLRNKKNAAAAASTKPAVKKAAVVDDEPEEEVEEEVQPTKTVAKAKPGLKPKVAAKPAPKEEEEEELEDPEEVEEDPEELEEDPEGEENEDENPEDDESDYEEVEEAPKSTKVAAKAKPTLKGKATPTAKVSTKVATKPVGKTTTAPAEKAKVAKPAVAAEKPKGGLFGKTIKPKETMETEVEEGAIYPRHKLEALLAERMNCSKADAANSLKAIEDLILTEVFPLYSLNLFGVKFKRSVVEMRYHDGTGGLTHINNDLTTEVSEHIRIAANIYIGKEKRRGIVDEDSGEFIEGIMEDGEFVPGTYNEKGEFVPEK